MRTPQLQEKREHRRSFVISTEDISLFPTKIFLSFSFLIRRAHDFVLVGSAEVNSPDHDEKLEQLSFVGRAIVLRLRTKLR